MKLKATVLVLTILVVGSAAFGQATTKMDCTTDSLGNLHCTAGPTTQEQAREAGAALGGLISAIVNRPKNLAVSSFCRKNPGQIYRGVQCLTHEQLMRYAVYQFICDNPQFHQSEANSKVIMDWLAAHPKEDLTKESSYRHAFYKLKEQHKVELNR